MSQDSTAVRLQLLGSQHQLGADMLVELLGAESLELHSTLLQSKVLLVSVLGHLGGHVVTNYRVQASHKHQTIIQLEFAIKSKGGGGGSEEHTSRGEGS